MRITPSELQSLLSAPSDGVKAPVERRAALQDRLEFNGLTTRLAKRRALNFWYQNRTTLGMSACEFFGHCRLSTPNGMTRITFYVAQEHRPAA